MSDSIYKRIVEARKSAGLDASQVAIARDLGIAQSNVSYWKSGGKPKIEHALKIAFQTGASLDWIYTGRPPKKAIKAVEDLDQILEALSDLDAEDRALVLKFARFRASD